MVRVPSPRLRSCDGRCRIAVRSPGQPVTRHLSEEVSRVQDVGLDRQTQGLGVIPPDRLEGHLVLADDGGFFVDAEETVQEMTEFHPDGFQKRHQNFGPARPVLREVEPVILARLAAGVSGTVALVHASVAGLHVGNPLLSHEWQRTIRATRFEMQADLHQFLKTVAGQIRNAGAAVALNLERAFCTLLHNIR